METVICNAGTTGAAGLRYLEKEKGTPFSCAVLTFYLPAPPRSGREAAVGPSSAPGDSPGPTGATPLANTTPTVPGGQAGAPPNAPPARPILRAIDLIALKGSFGEYSISHYTFHADVPAPPTP